MSMEGTETPRTRALNSSCKGILSGFYSLMFFIVNIMLIFVNET